MATKQSGAHQNSHVYHSIQAWRAVAGSTMTRTPCTVTMSTVSYPMPRQFEDVVWAHVGCAMHPPAIMQELLDATFSRENITQSLIGLPEHMVGCTIANLERLLNASTAISTTGVPCAVKHRLHCRQWSAKRPAGTTGAQSAAACEQPTCHCSCRLEVLLCKVKRRQARMAEASVTQHA
jgi:hypothetical protein